MSILENAALLFHESIALPWIVLLAIALLVINKRVTLLLALVLALLFIPVLKEAIHQERPCFQFRETFLLACPHDYGMPSAHGAIAAIFILAALGTESFWLFLPIMAFAALSRVILNLHTVEQVAAGLAFGGMVYFLSNHLVKDIARRWGWKHVE